MLVFDVRFTFDTRTRELDLISQTRYAGFMPEIRLFQDSDGTCPVLGFLDNVPPDCRAKARERVALLADRGHRLRRPHADLLRDGIYELRWKYQRMNYRILYFFHGSEVVVLAHALTKERRVPPAEIERAIRRRDLFETNPGKHTYEGASQ
jgi:phage-related protein